VIRHGARAVDPRTRRAAAGADRRCPAPTSLRPCPDAYRPDAAVETRPARAAFGGAVAQPLPDSALLASRTHPGPETVDFSFP
jgi:hypothetical protein